MEQKIKCECGAHFSPKHRWWHDRKSKQHSDWLEEKFRKAIKITAEENREVLEMLSQSPGEVAHRSWAKQRHRLERSIKWNDENTTLRIKLCRLCSNDTGDTRIHYCQACTDSGSAYADMELNYPVPEEEI